MSMGFLVYEDIAIALLGCRPVSSRLVSIRPGAYRFMHQHLVMTTMRLATSTKERHSSFTRGLECLSWVGCTGRLGRRLWTLLQCRDK